MYTELNMKMYIIMHVNVDIDKDIGIEAKDRCLFHAGAGTSIHLRSLRRLHLDRFEQGSRREAGSLTIRMKTKRMSDSSFCETCSISLDYLSFLSDNSEWNRQTWRGFPVCFSLLSIGGFFYE